MPGALDAANSGKSSPSTSGGGGALGSAGPRKSSKKKGFSLLDAINPINIGKDMLGTAGELIALPQQLVFGTANAVGELSRGNLEGATHALAHVGKEAITLGQNKGNWDFARTLGTFRDGKATPHKLPKGVNMGATVLLDPANALAIGKGAQARQGLKMIGNILGMSDDAVKKTITQHGTKALLGDGVREAVESQIVKNLQSGSKKYAKVATKKGDEFALDWAGKRAAKVTKAVEERGMGGIHAHIPGTSKTKNLVTGAEVKGATQGVTRLAKAIPGVDEGVSALSKSLGPVTEWAGRAFIPGKELAKKYGDEVSSGVRKLGSARIARQEARIQNLVAELSNAAKTVENKLGRNLTVEEDALILRGLQSGKAAREEIIQANPHLAPVMKTAERVREGMTLDQLKAQVLKSVHDTDTYARRVMTEEGLGALGQNPDQMNRLASQVGGNLSGSLTQKSAKARKLFPEMPDAVVNEMLSRVHNGEVAADVIADPKYAQYIGASQKAKAESILAKNIEQIKAQPVTEKSAAAWENEAEEFFKQADEKIKTALDDGVEEVEIGGSTYLTPKTDVEKGVLYDYIKTLKSGQNIDPTYHGYGFSQMLADVQHTYLPKEIDEAIQVLKGNGSKAQKQPSYDKLYQWIESHPKEYTAYKKELIKRMKDMGYEDEIFVFRGWKKANEAGKYANTSVTYDIAGSFAEWGTQARIYRVKLSDIVHGMAGPFGTENELVFKLADMKQLHPDELKFLRTKKKVVKPKGFSSNLSDVEKAVIKAQADELKRLGEQAKLNAGQVVKSGAVTPSQVQNQISAAFQLAIQNSDTTGLEKILAGQLEYIAGQLPPGTKLYEESAMLSLLTKGNESARAIEAANYVNDLRAITVPGTTDRILYGTEEFAKAPPHVKKGGLVPKEYPIFGTLYADPALHEEMQRVLKNITQDGAIEQFDGFIGKWERFWKTHATVGLLGSLPFGMRNLRSNGWLMIAGGMAPNEVLSYSKQAMNFQRKIAKIMSKGKFADDVAEHGLDKVLRDQLSPQDYKLFREAQDQGVITQGFFDFDFDETAASKLRKIGVDTPKSKESKIARGVKFTLSTKGGLAQKGRDLNSALEHNSRLAVFMREVDKGSSYSQAADRVKELLFDYSDLTPLEQKRLKKIVPFYTFMRKNLPLQFRTLAENPGRIVVPEKLRDVYSEPLPEDAPDYQQEAGARVLKDWVPLLGGMTSTPDRPFSAAVDVVSPALLGVQGKGKEAARAAANVPSGGVLNMLKYIQEQGTGTDLFTGNKINPDEGPIQRLVQSQLPSVGRTPRIEQGGVSPVRAVTGKRPKPTAEEILKLLTGIRAARQ